MSNWVNGGDWSSLPKDLWSQALFEVIRTIDERMQITRDWLAGTMGDPVFYDTWDTPSGLNKIKPDKNELFPQILDLVDGPLWEDWFTGSGGEQRIESRIFLLLSAHKGFLSSGLVCRPCINSWVDGEYRSGSVYRGSVDGSSGDTFQVPEFPGLGGPWSPYYKPSIGTSGGFYDWIDANCPSANNGGFPINKIPALNSPMEDISQMQLLLVAREALDAMGHLMAFSVNIKGSAFGPSEFGRSFDEWKSYNEDVDEEDSYSARRESLWDTARGAQGIQSGQTEFDVGFPAQSFNGKFVNYVAHVAAGTERLLSIGELRPDLLSPDTYLLNTAPIPGVYVGGSIAMTGQGKNGGVNIANNAEFKMKMLWSGGSFEYALPPGGTEAQNIQQTIDPAGWPPTLGDTDENLTVEITSPSTIPWTLSGPYTSPDGESGSVRIEIPSAELIVIQDIGSLLTYG